MNTDELQDSEMPLIEHLKELKTRVVRAGVVALIAMFICFLYYKELWVIIVGPIIEALEEIVRSGASAANCHIVPTLPRERNEGT